MNMMQKKFTTLSRGAYVRLAVIIFTVVYITTLLLMLNSFFAPIDPIPTLEQISQQEKARASRVLVGFHANSFPSFSFSKNDFLIDGILWFRFPSGAESLATLNAFSIHNSLVLPNGNLVYKSPPIVKLIKNDVLLSYHIQVAFKAHLNHKNFPFSSHRLIMMVQNKSTTPQELYFESHDDCLTINKDNLLKNWEPTAKKVFTGHTKAVLNPQDPGMAISYPAAAFAITFENIGVRDLISLYFPMFVLFFIALFCLLIDISDSSRLSYVATAVPILVLFRMVIDGTSPDVGYTTHIDFVYYLLVFLSLLILLFQTYVILALQNLKILADPAQEELKQRLTRINNNVFLGALLLLIAGMTYSFFR